MCCFYTDVLSMCFSTIKNELMSFEMFDNQDQVFFSIPTEGHASLQTGTRLVDVVGKP